MLNDTWWRQLADLDEDQQKVIGLQPDGSFLVIGPPGSGKTNLLLLRANYLSKSEHWNLAVIVFNQTLRNFIRSGAERYSFNPDQVQTMSQFFYSILEESGISTDQEGDFKEVRKELAIAAKDLVGNNSNPAYDVILLDEAQDYLPEELEVIKMLCHDIFMVADSRQQIYSDTTDFMNLQSMVNETIPLPYHYRCGLPICNVADGIGKTFTGRDYEPIAPTCNYGKDKPKSSVEVVQGTFETQCANIADRLRVQLRAYSDEMLAVICPRHKEVSSIIAYLKDTDLAEYLSIQTREDGYQQLDSSKPIWVSTIHSAKGLEFGAVHLAGAEYVNKFRGEQKRLAYTAVTRAKTSLTVYHDKSLPLYFDSALNEAQPGNRTQSNLEIAFGEN